VIAEGAGAASLAAALGTGEAVSASGTATELPAGPLVCVISGGNIDATKLSEILAGRTP
jgi:threonine dehydratase